MSLDARFPLEITITTKITQKNGNCFYLSTASFAVICRHCARYSARSRPGNVHGQCMDRTIHNDRNILGIVFRRRKTRPDGGMGSACRSGSVDSRRFYLAWARIAMILGSAMTVIARRAFNGIFAPFKTTSYTFPFIAVSWVILLAARLMGQLPPVGEAQAIFPTEITSPELSFTFIELVKYWLRGISQVFLVD